MVLCGDNSGRVLPFLDVGVTRGRSPAMRLRLLFLVSRLPFPPHRGDKLRTFNFLRTLSQHHDIALVSFIERRPRSDVLKALRAYCRSITLVRLPVWRSWSQVAFLYARHVPSQVTYYASRAMARAVRNTVAEFHPDIAYVHLVRMMPYASAFPPGVHTILDLTDVISKELFRSLPYRREWGGRPAVLREAWRTRAYERWATAHVDETWVITEDDRRDLVAAGGEGEIVVVPNGPPEQLLIPRAPDPASILFYGYGPVAHTADALMVLLRDILPRVRKQIPNMHLLVVGAGRHGRFPLIDAKGITYRGFLERPEEAFSRAALLVYPVRFSAGVSNKLLEAMAAGVPVVTTPLGNEGIDGRDRVHLAIAATPEEFSARIVDLLSNPSVREAMGKRGRELILEQFSWRHVRERVSVIAERLR